MEDWAAGAIWFRQEVPVEEEQEWERERDECSNADCFIPADLGGEEGAPGSRWRNSSRAGVADRYRRPVVPRPPRGEEVPQISPTNRLEYRYTVIAAVMTARQ